MEGGLSGGVTKFIVLEVTYCGVAQAQGDHFRLRDRGFIGGSPSLAIHEFPTVGGIRLSTDANHLNDS